MKDKKARRYNDVRGDVLGCLAEDALKIMTQLVKNIYESGEWHKDFTEVTVIAVKKKSQATKCSDHRTVSLIAHTAKIVARILRRRFERKTVEVLEEDQFRFRREKYTRVQLGCRE
jgi:hypothetical protein